MISSDLPHQPVLAHRERTAPQIAEEEQSANDRHCAEQNQSIKSGQYVAPAPREKELCSARAISLPIRPKDKPKQRGKDTKEKSANNPIV